MSSNTEMSADFAFTISLEMPRKKKKDFSFGPRLALLRKARGLTGIQLAEATGSTQRSISYYENDYGVPPFSIVVGLARALSFSTDELLGTKTLIAAPVHEEDSETRRLGKKFQVVTQLPEGSARRHPPD